MFIIVHRPVQQPPTCSRAMASAVLIWLGKPSHIKRLLFVLTLTLIGQLASCTWAGVQLLRACEALNEIFPDRCKAADEVLVPTIIMLAPIVLLGLMQLVCLLRQRSLALMCIAAICVR